MPSFFSSSQKKSLIIMLAIFVAVGFTIEFTSNDFTEKINVSSGDLFEKTKPIDKSKQSPFSGIECENSSKRAFAIMLAQYTQTMPLSGAADADVVIEAPVMVGSPQRLLAIYQCQEPNEIGSVRSIRPYLVDIGYGFDAILASWGGSDSAFSRISDLKLDYLNALINPSSAFYRKPGIATPHNGFTTYNDVWRAINDLGFRQSNNFNAYSFYDSTPVASAPSESIEITSFFYPVKFEFDPARNAYVRYWNNIKQVDKLTNKDLLVYNVVVMKTTGKNIGDAADVDINSGGESIIYQAGRSITGTWSKNDAASPLKFFDNNGQEIKFIPGNIWIEVSVN